MQRSNSARWGMCICLVLMGISSSFSLFIIPLYITTPQSGLAVISNVSEAMFLLLSGAALASALSAFIQMKLGPKILLLFALLIQLIADIILAIPNNSLFIAIGCTILGFGLGFVPCAAPTLICCIWRNPQQRSMPLALWSLWTVLGSILVSISSHVINNWQQAFLCAIMLNVIAFVLLMAGIRTPLVEQKEVFAGNKEVSPHQALRNPWALLCFIMVLGFSFGFTTYSTFAPNYFHTYLGNEAASLLMELGPIVGIIASITMGALLRSTRKAPFMLLMSFIMAAIASLVAFYFSNTIMITISAIYFFFAFQLIMPAILVNAQWASPDPSVIGSVFGLLSFAFYAGALPASSIGGLILATSGSYFLVIIPVLLLSVIGLLCAFLFYLARSRYAEEIDSLKLFENDL